MTRFLPFYIPVFSATLLLSAFLLFGVQPLFGKMILPMLGGAPAVWNTAMVFFQAMLLAGYAYAYLTTRLMGVGAQAVLHILILLACAVFLPISIPMGWREPPAVSNPAFWQIGMMTVAIGGPFFVLAGTAPMLQRWFSLSPHPDAHNPYFLYAASNLGSMLALLLYPFVAEPLLKMKAQSMSWSMGYGLLILLTASCAFLPRRTDDKNGADRSSPANDNILTPARICLWLLLAFTPSSLMLGVTTYITTDMASVPLLWILPLALYVGTFIIAFARAQPVTLNKVLEWQATFLLLVIASWIVGWQFNKVLAIAVHLGLFFLTALSCHMQLAAVRPDARNLTAFYLIMSIGGVLGGIFNALIAPQVFTLPIEYMLVLVLSGFLHYQPDRMQSSAASKDFSTKPRKDVIAPAKIPVMVVMVVLSALALSLFPSRVVASLGGFMIFAALFCIYSRRRVFVVSATVVAAAALLLHPGAMWKFSSAPRLLERNYFGVMRVSDVENPPMRLFVHGTTLHGTQPLEGPYRMVPISYYYPGATPAGDVFGALDLQEGAQRIAVLGLGAGTVACFTHAERHFDFYEIDPDVRKIAENPDLFTYLSDCGSPYDVIIGDARLQIAKAPDGIYDLIFLDVFSSDNIPVHVMTTEAFSAYLRKLKPGGMILMNISNRHLDLKPVTAAVARDLGIAVIHKDTRDGKIPGTEIPYAGTMYALFAAEQGTLTPFLSFPGWHTVAAPPHKAAWSDDFSNIVSALRLRAPKAPPETPGKPQ